MDLLRKLNYLLPQIFKKDVAYLAILLLIGVFFEMMGLGILFPVMKLLLSKNIFVEFPMLKTILFWIDNPNQTEIIFLSVFFLIGIYLLKSVYLFYLTWRQAKLNSHVTEYLSNKLFEGYLNLPYSFHTLRNSSKLLVNIQNEIGSLYNSGQAIITLTIEMTLLVGVLGLMIWIEPLGAASLIVFFGFSAFIFQLFTSSKIKNWGNIRVMNVTQMNKTLLESFGAIKELKLLKAEEFFVRRIKKNLNNSSNVTIKQTTLQQIPRYYLEFVTIAGICSLILVMIIQSKPVDSILPTLGLFFAGAFRIIPSLNRIMGSLQAVQFLRPSIDLLYDEFYYINNYNNGNISKSFEVDLGFKNKFSMQNINFSYGSSNVCAIKDLSLDIYRGETIGLIGKSGSGKSTLIDLILGLYRPSSGEIKIDDQIVTERNIRKWQKKIGYVPQSIYLTDDTIRNNIAFGLPLEEINDNLLSDAIKDAQLTEFISNIELGLDTIIGEKGVRISGGQRQRIGIARALYKKPEILILDEATSALDNSTEEDFMKAVDLLKGERTIIIVAHRLSTLKNCDKIYSLSNGVLKIESKNSLIINR